jgi:NAD(P)-dependent dehydrogenase (short-subunit alcohol dehydrogenase family)
MRVFITGASSGIGAALARHYAAQGAQLGLTGRNPERLNAVVTSLPCDCSTYVLDVRDAAALHQAAQDFMQKYGTPDIVIANAGVSSGTLTEHEADLPAFRAIMDTNVLGLVHTFQPFIAALQRQGRGSLAGIASVAGLRGLPGAGAYSASKAAAIAYLESLRVELVGSGISVTTICPGYIKTPMTDVNPYTMPFLMNADIAAAKIARLIGNKRRYAILPWQMGVVGRLMKLIPAPLWDWAMKNAPHKPRLKWDWL